MAIHFAPVTKKEEVEESDPEETSSAESDDTDESKEKEKTLDEIIDAYSN